MKLAACMLLLSACYRESADIKVAITSELESFDPQLATSANATKMLPALFDTLTQIEVASGQLVPELASEWEANEDFSSWKFTLKDNIKWSDGTAITATDVIESWQRLKDPKTAAPYSTWINAASFTIQNEQIFSIHFPTPTPLFPLLCSFHSLAPIPQQLRLKRPGEFSIDIPFSGPYIIQEHRIRNYTRLISNPHYHNSNTDSIQSIDFKVIPSNWTGLNMFLSKEIDYLPQIPELAIPKIQETQPNALKINPRFATYFLRLKQNDGALSNKKLRQALNLSIDRKKLCSLLGGEKKPINTLVPPLTLNYSGASEITFAPRQALELYKESLEEEGLTKLSLDYLYPSSELNRIIAEFLMQSWQETLGLRITLNPLESKSFFPQQQNLNYQISHSSWIGDYYDPFTFLEIFQSGHRNNRSGYSNKKYDALLSKSQYQKEARLKTLSLAEQTLLEDFAIIPLFQDTSLELLRSNITGHTTNGLGIINFQEWRIANE
jgi:oligopeptide transport system substrate-binding protein